MEGAAQRYRDKVFHTLRLDQLSPFLRRVIIGVVGGTVLLLGLAMVVLPGPAFVMLPLGLAILATEFGWAQRAARKGGKLFERAKGAAKRMFSK